MALKSIGRNAQPNAPGSSALYLLPSGQASSISSVLGSGIATAIGYTGTWLSVVAQEGSLSASTNLQKQQQADEAYQHSISLTLVGDSSDLTAQLNEMSRLRWLALRLDVLGQYKLHGDIEEYLSLSYQQSSGTTQGGLRGYRLTLSGGCRLPERKYTGAAISTNTTYIAY